jgi:hypothetical protein
MKDWQHSIDIEKLKGIEKQYAPYNKFALSPFAKYKKNDIARDLHDDSLYVHKLKMVMFTHHISKVRTPITMYQNVVIGYKEKGDLLISHLTGAIAPSVIRKSIQHCEHPTWLGIWAEDLRQNKAAHESGWTFVGTKITTFGEMYNLFFCEPENAFGKRMHPRIDPTHNFGLSRLANFNMPQGVLDTIHSEFLKSEIKFTNHYSNYNKKNSWSAISLRGYSTSPNMIEKPIEMNKTWKANNHGWENMNIVDTELYESFPSIRKFLSGYSDFFTEIHRVRFMQLAPNEGELLRHTDQVDPDSGFEVGKLCRLHWPIITNNHVIFTVWEPGHRYEKGFDPYIERRVNMRAGHCWALDTRKPHTVINGGMTRRIHLVVDVVVKDPLHIAILVEMNEK